MYTSKVWCLLNRGWGDVSTFYSTVICLLLCYMYHITVEEKNRGTEQLEVWWWGTVPYLS